MKDALNRAAAHSFFLKIFFFPRSLLHAVLRKRREALLALGEESITLFFLRHPERMRLKDVGLLLLSFNLSLSLSMFMQDTLTPSHRNMSFVFFFLALLCIGPLDRLQRKRVRTVHLTSLFVFVVGALLFGFLGSLSSPQTLSRILLFFFGVFLSVNREAVAFSYALLLFPFTGIPLTAALLFVISLKRVVSRALAGKKLPSLSRSFLPAFLILELTVLGVILTDAISWHSLFLFFAYPAAFSVKSRREILLFTIAAIILAVCTFLNPARIPETAILLLLSLLGLWGKKGDSSL